MRTLLMSLIVLLSTPALAQSDLKQAFQREHEYLVSQREVLKRQERDHESSHREGMKSLLSEVKKGEKNLVAATSANDELFAEIQDLEKRLREQNARDGSLEATAKKARKTLWEVENSLRFENARDAAPLGGNTDEDFVQMRKQALSLLNRSVAMEKTTLAVRDEAGELKEREVLRVGRIGALTSAASGAQVLGPTGDGSLQELGVAATLNAEGVSPIYLFDRLLEKAVVKKPATLVDRAANMAPALLLTVLFAMVAGLFWALARE